MTSELKYLNRTKLKNPIAVAGLPGIALIGKLSVEYLIEKFKAEKFAELSSDKFPGWAIRENGVIRELKMYFYKTRLNEINRDLIIITSDAQASSPKDQHDMSNEIIDMLEEEGVDTVVTMAAFLESEEKKSPVVGAATDKDTAEKIEDHGVGLLSSGRIVGMNGLLISLSAERGMKGFCLLGTTKDKNKDPDASKRVVTMFSDIFDLKIDVSDFDDKIPELPKFKPAKVKMPSVSGKKSETSYIR